MDDLAQNSMHWVLQINFENKFMLCEKSHSLLNRNFTTTKKSWKSTLCNSSVCLSFWAFFVCIFCLDFNLSQLAWQPRSEFLARQNEHTIPRPLMHSFGRIHHEANNLIARVNSTRETRVVSVKYHNSVSDLMKCEWRGLGLSITGRVSKHTLALRHSPLSARLAHLFPN